MPDPQDNTKAGVEPQRPDLESPQDDGGGTASQGDYKDKEARTSNSYGHTRESGEQPKE